MSKKTPWYETFFDGLYGKVLASQFNEDRAQAEAKLIKTLLKLRKGQRVLDCPCGVGRITIPLAKMGLKMTGVDLTASYIRRARRRAKKEGLDIPFLRCDMRDIDFDGEFHAVVNWFTGFGYFDEAGNLRAAKVALAALKPDGQFLIDMTNKSWVLPRFAPRSASTVGSVEITQERRWDETASRIEAVWTLRKGRQVERHHISHRLYNDAELRTLLQKAGFREIRLYGWPPLGRLSRHSRRLIAVASRPKESS